MKTTNFKAARFRSSCILHISDLHFGKHDVKNYLDTLAQFLVGKEKKPTHILISGDIVHSPSKHNFCLARKSISEFYRSFGNPCTRLLVIPGNHDRHLAGNKLPNVCNKILGFEQNWNEFVKGLEEELWSVNNMNGDCGWREVVKSVYTPKDVFVYLGRGSKKIKPPENIEKLGAGSIMDIEYRLLFLLFDSSATGSFSLNGKQSKRWIFAARGSLSRAQIRLTKAIVSRWKRGLWERIPEGLEKLAISIPFCHVIACLHHHLVPRPYRCSFLKELRVRIREFFTMTIDPHLIRSQLEHEVGCSIVLTGHEHYPQTTFSSDLLISQVGSLSKKAEFKDLEFHPNCHLIEIESANGRPTIKELQYINEWKFVDTVEEPNETLFEKWYGRRKIAGMKVAENRLGIANLRYEILVQTDISSNYPNYVSTTVNRRLSMNVKDPMDISRIINLTLPSSFWFPGGGKVERFKWRKDRGMWNDICNIISYEDSHSHIFLCMEKLEGECEGTVEIEVCMSGETLLCKTIEAYKERYKPVICYYEEDLKFQFPIGAETFELKLIGFQSTFNCVPRKEVRTWSAPIIDKSKGEQYWREDWSRLENESDNIQQSINCAGDIIDYKGTILPPSSDVWIYWSLAK